MAEGSCGVRGATRAPVVPATDAGNQMPLRQRSGRFPTSRALPT